MLISADSTSPYTILSCSNVFSSGSGLFIDKYPCVATTLKLYVPDTKPAGKVPLISGV